MNKVLAVPGYFACLICRNLMTTSGLEKDPDWIAIECRNHRCAEYLRLYKLYVPLADVEPVTSDDIRWLART